jgi:uncharacterized protein
MNNSRSAGQFGPYRRMAPLNPGAVRWTDGFWAQRFRTNRDVTLPSMRAAMEIPHNGAVFSNLYVAAGLREGDHDGTNWSDGDCYKWIEAVVHTYGITRDPALDAAVDELIGIIAKAQDDDGYICTQVQLNPNKKRWGQRGYHELYNMGHLMTAASVHHQVTGKTTFLVVARRLADYLYGLFRPRPRDLAHFGWNPSNIMGLVALYRETGEPKYLELAGIFVTMRGSVPWPEFALRMPGGVSDLNPGDQNQDRVPMREESHAVGHAVTATYLYAGAADVYAETGEPALLEALERIWESSARRRMYITGAVGTYHQGLSMRGDKMHEAYGHDFELPNASAYNETCANIGNAMWNRRMLELTGDAKYADTMEQVIYNSGLSPISIEGTHFCYTNPLRWHGADHDALSHDTPERWETHDCYCCPPQVARTIARMQDWAYSTGPGELWVHLYGSSLLAGELEGERVQISQQTNYPWDGPINLSIDRAPAGALTLRLRVPGWAEGATIKVNGVEIAPAPVAGSYIAIQRTWESGDHIELHLPMEARLVQAHPKVEVDRNQVAVMRGPIVYCLESIDLPEAVRMEEIAIPRDIGLTPRYNASLLGGVVTLEGDGIRRSEPEWDGALYRPLPVTMAEAVHIRLIPYYGWNNRGTTEMAVWLAIE